MRSEGLANWNPLAWARSLATRRARGSVWGWNHRTRADHSDQNTVEVATSPIPRQLPSIRARTDEDELTLIPEEDYQEYLAEEERRKNAESTMDMAMMVALQSPGASRASKVRSLTSKTVNTMSDVVNSQRTILTSYDLSAPFRQGGILSIAHPSRIPRAYVNMLKAARSTKAAKAVMDGIKSRKYAEIYKDAGLYLAEADEGAEEIFKSIFAKKIPGVKMSERAYNAYLNTLRADSFDSLLDALKATSNKDVLKAGNAAYSKYVTSLSEKGFNSMDEALESVTGAQKSIFAEMTSKSITQKELEAIANYVNTATGRGNIGAMEKYANELSTIFFAPKLTTSRWQMLFGQPLYGGTSRTRMIIAGEYGKYLAGLGTLYGLAKMSGAEVTWDPRSSDFGKIRFGQNRIDPLSGLGKHAVYAARLITGQFEGSSGRTESIYDGKGRNNWDDITERYVRSTLAPLYGTAVTLAEGRGIDGKPYKIGALPYDQLPLSVRDIYEQYRDNDPTTATAMSLVSLHGGGIDTYEKKQPHMTKAQVIKAIENGEAIDAASFYK